MRAHGKPAMRSPSSDLPNSAVWLSSLWLIFPKPLGFHKIVSGSAKLASVVGAGAVIQLLLLFAGNCTPISERIILY